MHLLTSLLALVIAIAGHAALRRVKPRLSSVVAFLLIGTMIGGGLVAYVLRRLGSTTDAWATIAAYAFACELYIFFFSAVSGSISAALLYELRRHSLTSPDIEARFGGKAMVEHRLGKMAAAGLVSSADEGHRVTIQGQRLLWGYRIVRNFFWRAPLVPSIVTRTDAGPLKSVFPDGAPIGARVVVSNVLAIAGVALIPILIFSDHLAGKGTFIGDSDRLNHFLSILRFLTEGYRQGWIPTWDELIFGGFPVVPFTNPYPTSFLHLLWPSEDLYYAAGVVSCLLLVCAGIAAYAFNADLKMHPLAAFVGASLYVLCAFSMLKISQNDITYTAVVAAPLLLLCIRRTSKDNLLACFLGLTFLLAYMMDFAFLQKVGYLVLLASTYALYRSIVQRSAWPVAVLAAAGFVALIGALPRVYAVGREFVDSARHIIEAHTDFGSYHSSLVFGPHELLRWLDGRIFGRSYEETWRLGNIINSHEGFLLYASTFATFVFFAGLIRKPRDLTAKFAVQGDGRFFLAVIAFCALVVATKAAYYVVYLLFFKIEFIHARIVIAAMLPLFALTAYIISRELREASGGELHKFVPSAALAAIAAVLVCILMEMLLAKTYNMRTVPFPSRFTGVPYHLATSALFRIALSAILFAGAAWLIVKGRSRQTRTAAVVFIAFATVAQAGIFAREQIGGPHTRNQWPPFSSPARVFADAGQFKVPSEATLEAFGTRLQSTDFRTSVVCPKKFIGIYCSPHLAHFWKIRMIDGYLYSVPNRLAALPWGKDALQLRSLGFDDEAKLPWGLLGLYNVKSALLVNPEFMTNFVRLPSGGYREAQPTDVRIIDNPRRVAPRVFFATEVTGAKNLDEAVAALTAGKDATTDSFDPASNSVAEGFEGRRRFEVGNFSRISFRGDRIDVEFSSAPGERFLVLNERFDAGWTAHSDDKQLHVYPANVLMRAVIVPAGSQKVQFRYIPPTATPAAFALYAVAAALLTLFGWLFYRVQRDARKRPLAPV
jgi:hypothetical protein